MKSLYCFMFVLFSALPLFSQWSSDSTVNNIVNVQSGQQNIHNAVLYQQCLAVDGAGGVIVAWQDTRNNAAIYTQRVDNNGNLKWDPLGIPAATLASNVWNVLDPCITSDGKGGAIIVWQRNASGSFDSLFAQRVDVNGNIKWTTNGVPICENGNTNQYPVICSDNNGGAIIAWQNDIPFQYTINAQRIDSSGVVQWATDGVIVRTSGVYHYNPQICSDGNDGAIISWLSGDSHNSVNGQRIDGSGNLKWSPDANPPSSANAISISGSTNHGGIPRIISDGSGGAIVCYQNSGSGTNNVTTQRIDANGGILWGADGVAVCIQRSEDANITSDGSGGVIIAWSDYRAGTGWWNIYTQHITSTGTASWTADGIAIQNISKIGSAIYPSIAADGSGGAYIAWIDNRSGNNQLYEQSISNSGTVNWLSNGITVSKFSSGSGPGQQQIISGGSNNSILVWEDTRNSGATNLYAQGVSSAGALPVELVSFTASSTKNSVELKWKTATEVNNYGFEVERASSRQGWEKIGFVKGNGNSNSIKKYEFIDKQLSAGKLLYRLKQIDNDGSFKYSPEVIVEIGSVPPEFNLAQNYPNPFNPETMIDFTVHEKGLATLKIFNILGKEVATLFNEFTEAGVYHHVKFDGSRLATGVYIAKLESGNKSMIKKMLMIK